MVFYISQVVGNGDFWTINSITSYINSIPGGCLRHPPKHFVCKTQEGTRPFQRDRDGNRTHPLSEPCSFRCSIHPGAFKCAVNNHWTHSHRTDSGEGLRSAAWEVRFSTTRYHLTFSQNVHTRNASAEYIWALLNSSERYIECYEGWLDFDQIEISNVSSECPFPYSQKGYLEDER